VSYKENTVTVELENEAVIKTETIMIDGPAGETKIVKVGSKQEEDGKGVIIVSVALGVICLIMIGLCFRQFVIKPKQQIIELEDKIKRAKNVVEPKEENSNVSAVTKKAYHGVNRDSVIPEDMVQYEQQYDPNNDFRIFGVGDHTQGGIQDMKEKMNMADKIEEESSSESEFDSARQGENQKRKDFIPSVTQMESRTSKDGLSGGSTGGKSSEDLKKDQLPEDKEIQSSSEDE